MDKNTSLLRKRLEKIWQPPNFIAFFEKFTKRTPHAIKKATVLFNEGDPLERLYCIKEGFVKLYRLSAEGRETTAYLFGPGNVLGLRANTSKDGAAKHNAEALTDLTILTMSRNEYFDALSKHPEFVIDLAYMFMLRLNYTEKRLEGFIAADTTSRIANFFSDCAVRFGKTKNGKVVLPLKLSHQRIAEFVGALRETVTISLQKLEKEKIIKNEKGSVIILNLKKLNQLL